MMLWRHARDLFLKLCQVISSGRELLKDCHKEDTNPAFFSPIGCYSDLTCVSLSRKANHSAGGVLDRNTGRGKSAATFLQLFPGE